MPRTQTAGPPPGARRTATGWGRVDRSLSASELEELSAMLAAQVGSDALWRAPTPAHRLQLPRLAIPDALRDIVTADHDDRLLHAVGRSFTDVVALRETGVSVGPDAVARPRTDDEVEAVLSWCSDVGASCIPFGGGTSVVGGVTAGAVDGAVVALQTRRMGRVVEVDAGSRAALIEAGATGPGLEDQLRPHGLTMRFFPQSFEMSTLGGWVATRASGHYATRLVHVDDLVESVDAVTPAGRWASRRLPGSGAGPSPDRLLLGSEGILGVITRAWVRLQAPPRFRGSATVAFERMADAMTGLRHLVQSGLDPAGCRVLDPVEAMLNGAGDGSAAVLLLTAESPQVPVDHDLQAMAELLADHGGTVDGPNLRVPAPREGAGGSAGGGRVHAGEAWRSSFLRAPYLRDGLVDLGMVVETFETAVTFDRLHHLVADVMDATTAAVREVCGGGGVVTCRITHAYPDGAAPYFTVIAPGRPGGRAAQWAEVKAAASEALLAAGGTITHHHAVGRDHRPWYDRQRPDPFAAALTGAKAAVDRAGILNPGVLLG